jgi:hypothetical protein
MPTFQDIRLVFYKEFFDSPQLILLEATDSAQADRIEPEFGLPSGPTNMNVRGFMSVG